jgi:hypothetical protein
MSLDMLEEWKRKEVAMCTVLLRVECSDSFSELLTDDKEHAELSIESIVGTALLELFDIVHVENVTIHFPSDRTVED